MLWDRILSCRKTLPFDISKLLFHNHTVLIVVTSKHKFTSLRLNGSSVRRWSSFCVCASSAQWRCHELGTTDWAQETIAVQKCWRSPTSQQGERHDFSPNNSSESWLLVKLQYFTFIVTRLGDFYKITWQQIVWQK